MSRYGMLDPDEKDSKGLPLPARAVFVVGPDKRLKLSILYPATTGRNFPEVGSLTGSPVESMEASSRTLGRWKRLARHSSKGYKKVNWALDALLSHGIEQCIINAL